IPRSASNSSTSRYERPKRRYQRTASTITSGGKQKPAKADRAMGSGRTRRVLMTPVWLLGSAHSRCNSALVFLAPTALIGAGVGWVAWRTQSLRWTLSPHVATDASGLRVARFWLDRSSQPASWVGSGHGLAWGL